MSLSSKYSKNKDLINSLSNLLKIDVKYNGLHKGKLLKNNTDEDEVKGLPYLCYLVEKQKVPILVKVCPGDIDDETDNSINEIVHLLMLNEIILYTKLSPNIPTLYHYNVEVPNNSKCLNHVPFKKIKKKNKIKETSHIFFCEYFPHRDIDSWIENNYSIINDTHWKSIIFQVIYTLAVLQDKFHFMHNDLHPGNVLIDSVLTDTCLTFKLFDKVYYVENTGYIPKLWDFEFSNMFKEEYDEYRNIIEFDMGYNPKYDPHVFLKGLLEIEYLPEITRNFIETLYPHELLYINSSKVVNTTNDTVYLKNGCLTMSALEIYILPEPKDILNNDYFKEYQQNTNISSEVNKFVYPVRLE
jgi:serine/threonine protein kinase